MTSDLLIFEIENVLLAVSVEHVQEVVHAVAFSQVPGHLSDYEGMINYRGTPVLVFDLRKRLGLPARPIALNDCLILMNLGKHSLAFRADRSLELHRMPETNTRANPGNVPHPELFHGMIEYREQLAFLIDPFQCLPHTPPSQEGSSE